MNLNNNNNNNNIKYNKKDLDSINVEIIALEEIMLACLTKKTDKIVKNIDDLYSLCSNILFYKDIFIKSIYLYQTNLHCSSAVNNSFFSPEEEALLIKVHAYHIDNLDIKNIIARHRKLSYILFLDQQIQSFNQSIISSRDVKEGDIYNFLANMQSSFDNRFDFIDNKIITPNNLSNFIEDLFFDKDNSVIKTGYKDLDYHIGGGMRVGDIVIIAAQPGSAKTMMCLNILCNNIKFLKEENKKILYFCPDMHMRYVYRRIWSMYTGQPQSILKNTSKEIIAEDLRDLPIITSESACLEDIIRTVNYYNKQIKVVMIDYIQLLYSTRYTTYTKHEQISKIIADLKKVIREHNILLILVSQINREASKTNNVSITHLKDSSALEQDSDIVFLLSNLSQQGGNNTEYDEKANSTIRLLLGKNRHGKQNVAFNFTMNKENFRMTHEKKEEIRTGSFKTHYSIPRE